MLKLRKVAVTGGLSCGKSSVCRIFKELGAYVVSTDKIVHQLLSSNTGFCQKVIALLGPQILVNQEIDRSRVAQIVFQDKQLLQALEKLTQPIVYKELEIRYQHQNSSSFPPSLFVAEIPLLFESGHEKEFDVIITVTANKEISLQRFIDKTGYTRFDFDKRMKNQIPTEEKAISSNYIIHNEGSFEDLHHLVTKIYYELINC